MIKKLETVLNHANQHCANNGVQLTEKRKTVLTGLLASEKALSAYELADYCREHLATDMPPMSVYRILSFLESQQLVHKLSLANKYIACSHITCDHGHDHVQFLICNQCQDVKETRMEPHTLHSIEKKITEAGFHLASPQLEINAVCDLCFRKSNS